MLRAIIFDCDGVIADTEPLHLASFQKVLTEEGIAFTEDEYYRHYLALDDRGCFAKAFSSYGLPLDEKKLAELIERKSEYFEPVIRQRLKLFPGVTDFIKRAARKYPLAVASGALRREIELILQHGGVRDCFKAIVSAEDVARGKPDPESFLKACSLISAGLAEKIAPRECLIIEDSIQGVRAARLAGMRCLAVTNSYGKNELLEAEQVIDSFAELSLEEVEALFAS